MSGRHQTWTDLPLLAGFVALCLFAGYLGSVATTPNIEGWYRTLEKPFWTPPDAAFPIVWTILYCVMAVAAWLVARSGHSRRRPALIAFFIQLLLNVSWSWAFFGLHSPALGMLVIVALIAAIVWTMRRFAQVDRVAAALLTPYLAWVAYASTLNAAILALNA